VLRHYARGTLRTLMLGAGVATALAYLAYTLAPHTRAFFGTWLLVATVPFPAFGLFRFAQLVNRDHGGDAPTDAMLRDAPFVLNVALWGAAVISILYVA